jgi:hypothetical protein
LNNIRQTRADAVSEESALACVSKISHTRI